MTAIEITNLAAILIGPVAAVLIGLWFENRKEKRRRKLDVFRTLMRTRASRLSGEHVAGLNIVEIEFQGYPNVMGAWKEYMNHLNPVKSPFPDGEVQRESFIADRNRCFTKLLHEIGVSLRFRIDQLDILKDNYTPQGWANEEEQQRQLRVMFIDLLAGKRALSVMPHNPSSNADVFPLVPEIPLQNGSHKSTDQ